MGMMSDQETASALFDEVNNLRVENARLRADIDTYERTAQIIATLPPLLERVRHVKRGTEYEVIGEAELQVATRNVFEEDRLIVYRSVADGKMWAREASEFRDGRFVPSDKTDAPDASE